MTRTIVVAITGASGAAYAVRLLDVLIGAGCNVHLSISPTGAKILGREIGLTIDLDGFEISMLGLGAGTSGQIRYHDHRDFEAPIASGSFRTDGMVVCPCSTGTLSAIAHSSCINLIHRAAEVHLKERRRLVLVPRETPLSLVQLDNMKRAAAAGAIILPASPGFYHGAAKVADLVDFIVGRICDQLDIENDLVRRWGS
ncbi:MAG: UbiX family flavin prenyltransferase [Phycisphaerae bacterium]|nr:UbiX family flavin prenyltransferase [Phycisphaerae bacterium]